MAVNDGTTIYTLLGIEPNATPDQVKSGYRKSARKFHPDHNGGEHAAENFRKVKRAYELLSDEERRKDWHRKHAKLPWLWGGGPENGAPPRDAPHPDLDWICEACEVDQRGTPQIRRICIGCQVRMCMHFTFMMKIDDVKGKHPVCMDCRQKWNDKKHGLWKIKRMMSEKGFGI